MKPSDFYSVLTAMAPLYVSMVLAYACVRWYKMLTPEQCAGVNRIVALVSVPFYIFNFVASNDPYSINVRFVLSDTIQKVLVLVGLLVWEAYSEREALDWVLTLFSLATLPNVLLVGVPLLTAMYGESSASLMIQLVLLQVVVWNTVISILFEYRAAKTVITKTVPPDSVNAIASFRVESDIISLNDHESLCAETEGAIDGTVSVVVRNRAGSKSRRSSFSGLDYEITALDHQVDLGSVDIESMERLGSRKIAGGGGEQKGRKNLMPPTNVITWAIVRMVLRKMIKNPNIWASLLGLAWALISYKFDVHLPAIVNRSIQTLSDTCSAMCMFTLGFFLALQPKLITCGKLMACLAMVTRFLVGPIIAGLVSAAIGLRGDLLRISVVQAALSQAIIPFVYAKEYDAQPDIISTTVTFGMIVSLPVCIIYYMLLGL